MLFVVGIDGAPLRYRARLPAEGLELLGIETAVRHYRDPDLPELLAKADAAVFYRVPATIQILELIKGAQDGLCPTLFDVDDLIFDPDLARALPALSELPADEVNLYLEGVRRYRTTMEACDVFVGSTEELCHQAAAIAGMPAVRFANGVGILLGRLSDLALKRPKPTGPPRLGYFSGTTTHDGDWALIEPVVLDAMDRHGDIELWLGGHLRPSAAIERHGTRVHRLPMVPWTELPSLLRTIDVNLAPLAMGGPFNEAKSAIKWLEAALVATPTIASPTAPFREAIVSGETGFLADGDEAWAEGLDRLVADSGLRELIGRRARRAALLQWSPHLQGRRYLEILELAAERVAEGGRRQPSNLWRPVALDEPPVPVTLEPYNVRIDTDPPSGWVPSPPPSPWCRLRDRMQQGVRLALGEGMAEAARRAAHFARRRLARAARAARHRLTDTGPRRG